LVENFKDGVVFIPLAPVSDPELVAMTITQTLRITETGDWTPVAALKNYLRDKSMLLVLDNFEQLLEAASLVAELLQSCPGLKILATSRAPLKISGERQYPLTPLQLPDLDRLPAIETLSKIPSIALFVARAGLVDQEFTLKETNAGIVAEICHHLDGLPLAIELAAAWIKLLPPQKLLNRLSNRLSLLQGGPVDLPPRQRTLRAAIDWSYQLIDDWEQTLLARLTVFVGGWTLEAASAVAGWNGAQPRGAPPGDVLVGLSSLVDKSLVKRQETVQGLVRFSMLEIICEYASEKLAARGEGEKEILQQQHAAYYLELAEASEPALRGPHQQLWLTQLKDEHNNLRVALQWTLDHEDAGMALNLAGSLWRYWWMHGHLKEGRDWLEKALAIPGPEHPALRARALNGVGVLARSQGDFANAQIFLEACLKVQRSLADRPGVASVLNSLGVLAQYQGDYDLAYKFHEESLTYRREAGNPRDIAVSLNNLAMVAQKAYAQARTLRKPGAVYLITMRAVLQRFRPIVAL
jgi:predicted ATPase